MMGSRSETSSRSETVFEQGQRLYCARCKSEIEIISPCTAKEPRQEFRCCGEGMRPSSGVSVHVNVSKSME